jgi:16S rRNA (cytosine1402-N4)-methyltransferase
LEKALSASEYLLAPDGRLAVVTFHSLEDRIVKNFMYHCAGKRSLKTAEQNQFDLKRQASRDYKKAIKKGDASFSRKQRVDKDEKVVPSFELTPKKHIEPTEDEVECNPRSRSAKLRVAKRTDAPALAPFGEPEFIFDE